jgi:hypothetical protein
MRCDPQFPNASDTHALYSVEEPVDQLVAIDAQVRHEGMASVLEPSSID